MALRIGGGMPPLPEQTAATDNSAVIPAEEIAPIDAMPPTAAESGGGFIDPESARYFGPESRCASCIHYMDPGACEIVSGPIDPAGVCMLYLSGGGEMPMSPPEMPAEEETPQEEAAPNEEPEA